MPSTKIKISKEELEKLYEITGDTEATPHTDVKVEIPDKQDTTHIILDSKGKDVSLTEDEEEYDAKLFENYPVEDIDAT